MSSKFSTGRSGHKSPPWCHPGLFPVPITYVDSNPAQLVVFAYWIDLNAAPPINVAESFRIDYRPATDDWHGHSAPSGLRLIATLEKSGPPGHYDVHLHVYRDDVYLDDDSWHDIAIEPPPQLDTGELHHVYQPRLDANGLHAVS